MKNILRTLLLLLLAAPELLAQGPYENLKKYWYYRYRLLNNFMYLTEGNERGTNMPCNQRGYFSGDALVWGDSPIAHGYYLGVLATEYALLKNEGQPSDSTIRELYLALEAINRLDYTAETYDGGSPSLNGFFIREDFMVYPNPIRISHEEHFSPEAMDHFNSGKVNSQFNAVERANNDTIEYHQFSTQTLEMSQDQIFPLVMGLALVAKLVDLSATYNKPFMDGLYYIKQEAEAITKRIFDFLDNNNYYIINPATGLCTTPSHNVNACAGNQNPPCLSNACGANLTWSAWGASEAGCKIKEGFPGLASPIWPPFMAPHTCTDFNTSAFAGYGGYQLWQGYTFTPTLGSAEVFLEALLAVGNSWYTKVTTPLGISYVNTTSPELGLRAATNYHEIFPLVRQVLHGGTNPIQSSNYEILMDEAPCQGPWFVNSGNSATWQWSSPNRFMQPHHRGGNPDWPGEYNGLDYMLLHNLYYIVKADDLPPFTNKMDGYIPYNLPITAPLEVGSHNNPLVSKAFRSINCSSTMSASANATFIAGEEVNISADIPPGAEVDIYNQYFNCGGAWLRTADSTNSGSLYGMFDNYFPEKKKSKALADYFELEPQAKLYTDTENPYGISCFPNPADNFTIIQVIPQPEVPGEYLLRDATGRLIASGIIEQQNTTVELHEMSAGYYLLEVQVNGNTEIFRIVKKK